MLRAKDIMTTDIATIPGMATVAEAIGLMAARGLRAFIVDRRSDDDAYGMITEADIVYKVSAQGIQPTDIRVFEVMTKPCITVPPDMGVEYVARLFMMTGIQRAPVVGEHLMGIVSVSDILRKAMRG